MKTTSKIQRKFFKRETVFGDTDGDMTSGNQILSTEIVNMDGLSRIRLPDQTIRKTRDDVNPVLSSAREGAIDIPVLISGAYRTPLATDAITNDALSEWLEVNIAGSGLSEKEAVSAGSTTTNIVFSGGSTYVVGDLVRINGEIRQITAVNGVTDFTVEMPFSTAPSAADVIWDCEYYFNSTDEISYGIAVEGENTEYDFLLYGCICTGLSLDAFQSKEVVKGNFNVTPADWDNTTATNTTGLVATREKTVYPDTGTGFQMLDSVGAVYSPCVASVTADLGLANIHVKDIGGINGICGKTATINDDAGVEAEFYQDGTYSKLNALETAGTSFPISMIVGSDSTGYIGIYYPEAYIKEIAKPSSMDDVDTVKVIFKTGRGYLTRS